MARHRRARLKTCAPAAGESTLAPSLTERKWRRAAVGFTLAASLVAGAGLALLTHPAANLPVPLPIPEPPEPPDPTAGSVPLVIPTVPSMTIAPTTGGARIHLPPFEPVVPLERATGEGTGAAAGAFAAEVNPAVRWEQEYPIRAARARRSRMLLERDGTTWVNGRRPDAEDGRDAAAETPRLSTLGS